MGRWEILDRPAVEPTREGPLFVNDEGRPALGRAILRTIEESERSLRIITPEVDDARVESALIAARKRRVRVKIVTKLRDDRDPQASFESPRSARQKPGHRQAIRRLSTSRIFCRGLDSYAHAKLVIADERTAWVSSANLDSNSLGWGRQPSMEAGIRLEAPEQVATLVESFETLWSACGLELNLDRSDLSLQSIPKLRDFDPIELDRDVGDLLIRRSWPPRGGRGLRDQLREVVAVVRSRLVLSALSLYETDRIAGFHEALRDALSRGVEVVAVVRPEHFPVHKYPDADPSTLELVRGGMRLLGVKGLHAKGILADDATCGLMSANYNPFSLDSTVESAHVECGIFGPSETLLFRDYSRFLSRLPSVATHRYRFGG
jgi:phosphatidylserine/phosphatidylglycerophosphate/cardiolipin synthase-like enzyme